MLKQFVKQTESAHKSDYRALGKANISYHSVIIGKQQEQ